MKKWLLFFGFFLLGSISLAGQGYRPMAVDSAIWQMKFYEEYDPASFDYQYYFCMGDTVINNQGYKKIYYSPWGDFQYDFLTAVIRDDTLEKKVYGINFSLLNWGLSCPEDEEFVLFDFSGNVGDTVLMCAERSDISQSSNFVITEIETVEFYGCGDCLAKKFTGYWALENGPIYDAYYEGIGWEYLGAFGSDWTWQGPGLGHYCIGSFQSCFGPISTKEVKGIIFSLSPNPTSDKIQLTWEKTLPKHTRVILSDVNGNTLQVITIQNHQQTVEINMEDLSSGLYFYRIVSAGRVLGRGKVVKE